MRLNQQPLLRGEDFPDFKEAGSLFNILNPFFADLAQIFDRNIQFTDNFRAVTQTFSQTGVTLPLRFAWPYPKFSPVELLVVKAKVDNVAACLACSWDYDASSGQISISELMQVAVPSNIAISATSKYEFTVRVII